MINDYFRMKEKNRQRIIRMYNRRIAGKMTKEQFFDVVNKMIRRQEAAANLDRSGTGFLASMATDRLRSSGLTETDDLWPWISWVFNVSWSEYYDNNRIKNAVGLACIRVFRQHNQQMQPDCKANTDAHGHENVRTFSPWPEPIRAKDRK